MNQGKHRIFPRFNQNQINGIVIQLSQVFNNPMPPAYVLVKPDELPSADAVLSFKEMLERTVMLEKKPARSILLNEIFTAIRRDSYAGTQFSGPLQNMRFASLIKVIQAFGESNPDFLADRILNGELERTINFICYPYIAKYITFNEQRVDFYKALASIPFTDEQAAQIIKVSIFSVERQVYEPELMCAAHWLNKMTDDDRNEILQCPAPVVFGYKSNHPMLKNTNSSEMSIADHLIASGVMDTKDIVPPTWARTLLEQPLKAPQP
jgi:hypothetical protein